jgi:hypothetical protein
VARRLGRSVVYFLCGAAAILFLAAAVLNVRGGNRYDELEFPRAQSTDSFNYGHVVTARGRVSVVLTTISSDQRAVLDAVAAPGAGTPPPSRSFGFWNSPIGPDYVPAETRLPTRRIGWFFNDSEGSYQVKTRLGMLHRRIRVFSVAHRTLMLLTMLPTLLILVRVFQRRAPKPSGLESGGRTDEASNSDGVVGGGGGVCGVPDPRKAL